MQPKQEEDMDGESDYFSCFSDDVDLLDVEGIEVEYTRYRCEEKGYDVLMDAVGRIEAKSDYKYQGEI